jgi:hypothetical protein
VVVAAPVVAADAAAVVADAVVAAAVAATGRRFSRANSFVQFPLQRFPPPEVLTLDRLAFPFFDESTREFFRLAMTCGEHRPNISASFNDLPSRTYLQLPV